MYKEQAMDTPNVEDEYIAAFDPREYLDECFAEPDAEYRFSVQFMVNALRNLPSELLVLELGGGPTLYSAAMLAPLAREIHFSDYVPASLDEVRNWLNGEAHAFDWRPYIEIILEQEGLLATPQAIADREAEVRRKVTQVTWCNILAKTPLGQWPYKYDLVVAPHCTDVAANSVSEWRQVVRNIGTLVAPGGWLFISVSTGTTINTVGSQVFECVDLTGKDIYQGYIGAGFDQDTLFLDSTAAPAKYEYTGVIHAIARKIEDTP